ncbi:MAG: M15 family metallopeptidase [Intestinibacillus sp.]
MHAKQALCAVLAVGAALSGAPTAWALADVSSWAVSEVAAAQKADLEPVTLLKRPATGSISREEFCGVALRLYAAVTGETAPQSTGTPFDDTDSADVATAYELGLVSGRGDGVFDPGGLITRQELCKTLDNIVDAAGLDVPAADPDSLSEYPDRGDVAAWAKSAVERMLGSGIIRGVSKLTTDETGEAREVVALSPTGRTTREQALLLGLRFTNTFASAESAQAGQSVSSGTTAAGDPEASAAEVFDDMKDFAQSGGIPSPLPKTEAEKMAFVFGTGGTYFATEEEAEAAMTEIEVPVWRLQPDGSKTTGKAYVTVNRALAPIYRAVFQEIYSGGEKFPIKDVGSYAWRPSPTSEHRWGTAIDINYDANMEATINADGSLTPTCGTHWTPGEDPYSIAEGGDVYNAFTKYGFSWGGNAWRSKRDFMHFSYFGR